MKKQLLVCLALVLALALTSTAQAVRELGGQTVITGEDILHEIEVSVPTLGNVMINPNQLAVEMNASIVDSQVVSVPAYIENLGKAPLKVSVEVASAVKSGSDVHLQGYSTVGLDPNMKRMFLYFELLAVNDPDNVPWADEFDEETHIVLYDGAIRIRKGIAILGAAGQEKRYGAFRLNGDCVAQPRTPWTEKDGVKVNIVFTFTPLPVWTEIP